jgi:hypothetical protein
MRAWSRANFERSNARSKRISIRTSRACRPATPTGGQWVDGGGSGSSERVRLAQNEPPDHETDVPRIPLKRPKTIKERNRGARILARFILKQIRKERLGRLIGPILDALEIEEWVREEYSDSLQTYIDPPKTLEELQRAVFSPTPGTQIHHIVEQGPAAQEGYPRSAIDASDNLVRIPTFKHEEITGWYGTPNKDFGGMKPRDYLRGKSLVGAPTSGPRCPD